MKKKYIALLISTLGVLLVHGQEPLVLSSQQAKEDFNWLQYALEYVHPRLYKFDDKAVFDARFDSLKRQLNMDISGLDFLAMLSQLNASVNCGHLYTIPQAELQTEVLGKKVLPFYIRVVNEEFYVFHDCSPQASIPNGVKILSINGKKSSEIMSLIKVGIATDGYIETRKMRLMERYLSPLFQGFDLYYHLHVDRKTEFLVEFEAPKTKAIQKIQLQGISMEERRTILLKRHGIDERSWYNTPSPHFELSEKEDLAILKLPRSFYNKKIDPNFDSLLHQAFAQLEEHNIQNLILDLRNNEGGSEHHQMELMSYLHDQPFKLYQNIYLSHLDFRPLRSITIERDSADFLFNNDDEYMRKLSHNLWINNYEYSKNLRLNPPKKNTFSGQLYVLINGITFSSAADLAADLRKTTNAIFIGEESGGLFEGPTGGNSIVIQLPHSKIMVRISPNIQIGSQYQKHPIGRGVLPDHPVEYYIDDLLLKRDLEMEKAFRLIKNGQ